MTNLIRLPSRPLVWALVWVALVLFGFVRGEPAAADIGVWSASRTTGEPGETVDLYLACGGCVPGLPGTARVGPRLAVSLLPLRSSLYRRECPSGLCTPTTTAAPAARPYVPLGVAMPMRGNERSPAAAERYGIPLPPGVRRHGEDAIRDWLANTNRLRFRIPDAKPGLYKYVIYCKGCISGPEGGLIQTPSATPRQRALLREQSEEVLHILPPGDQPAAEEAGGTSWWLVGLGLTTLAFAVLVAVRRLRRTS